MHINEVFRAQGCLHKRYINAARQLIVDPGVNNRFHSLSQLWKACVSQFLRLPEI